MKSSYFVLSLLLGLLMWGLSNYQDDVFGHALIYFILGGISYYFYSKSEE